MCACGTSRLPRGAALVIAMLVMAVLLMAGTTFLTISSTESQIALNEQVSAQAMLLAEAAIGKAIAQLNASAGYTGETNTALGGGTFTVSVTTVAGCTSNSARTVVASSVVPVGGGQAQVQLQATLDRVSYPFRWGAFAAIPNDIVGGSGWEKELWLGAEADDEDTSTTDSFDSSLAAYNASVNGTTNKGKGGNLGANGDVNLEKNITLRGNLTAGGVIRKGSGVTVQGTETSSLSPSEPFPSVSPGTASGALNVTGANSPLTLAAGTYYYTKITFASNTSLTTDGGLVTIYVTDGSGTAVNAGNNVSVGGVGKLVRIITRSDLADTASVQFNAGDNFTFYGTLYGKSTDIDLGDDAKIYGSMIGRTIKTKKRAAIHYDHAVSDQVLCHSGKFNIVRGTWREVIP